MKIKIGNLWNDSADLILVTTNSYVRTDGALVMGRGAALEFKNKYPKLPYHFGKKIIDTCGNLGEYNLLTFLYDIWDGIHFGLFQVKYHFKDKADIELIKRSTERLKIIAEFLMEYNNHNIIMNYPGIGFGQLSEDEVYPIISRLPDNVTIYKLK